MEGLIEVGGKGWDGGDDEVEEEDGSTVEGVFLSSVEETELLAPFSSFCDDAGVLLLVSCFLSLDES